MLWRQLSQVVFWEACFLLAWISLKMEIVMPWTLIIHNRSSFSAITEILSFDSKTAWKQAKEKHPALVGMIKGEHEGGWVSYE